MLCVSRPSAQSAFARVFDVLWRESRDLFVDSGAPA
jgi:hypothetical protein